MPVWHRATKKWRESGELVVVGITQEQHPERCVLFKQWHQIDWPVLWDPFNTTGSKVVPGFTFVDEHGVVQGLRQRFDQLKLLLKEDFPEPEEDLPAAGKVEPRLIERQRCPDGHADAAYLDGLSELLWSDAAPDTKALAALVKGAAARKDDPARLFRLGVALRMRWDSADRQPGDFQGALNAWQRALEMQPDQYIWRRRIQQYGPWLDKPYPFYDWVGEAQAAIRARGEEPIALRAPLSGAERGKPPSSTGAPAKEPDPEGKIARTKRDWLEVDSAVAYDTGGKRPVARVHLTFRQGSARALEWNNEAEPMQVWISVGDLPDGATTDRNGIRIDNAATASSSEPRSMDFEVTFPDGATGKIPVKGYALFNACLTANGTCLFLRRDFEVQVSLR